MSRNRCYLTLREEKMLPAAAQKELRWLRNKLKNEQDLSHYHLCWRLGDVPSARLREKFDSEYLL